MMGFLTTELRNYFGDSDVIVRHFPDDNFERVDDADGVRFVQKAVGEGALNVFFDHSTLEVRAHDLDLTFEVKRSTLHVGMVCKTVFGKIAALLTYDDSGSLLTFFAQVDEGSEFTVPFGSIRKNFNGRVTVDEPNGDQSIYRQHEIVDEEYFQRVDDYGRNTRAFFNVSLRRGDQEVLIGPEFLPLNADVLQLMNLVRRVVNDVAGDEIMPLIADRPLKET